MKKPTVDYKNLRLSNITSSQYNHLLLLFGWVVYFLLFFLTENLIPAEKCFSVHSRLDDIIPFCEAFALAYVGWYGLIVFSLLYFAFYSTKSFKNMQKYIIITQIIGSIIFIIFPTRQDLRPTEFARDNFLTDIMGLIYTIDTNTGVCPSLHVAYSLGIASTWVREKSAAPWVKGLVVAFAALVCLSVVFVKQHSVIDILAAIPVCIVAEWFVFFRTNKKKQANQ